MLSKVIVRLDHFPPGKRLLEEVEEGNRQRVSKLGDDELELVLIDLLTLNVALRMAAMRINRAIARLLVDTGADACVNNLEGSRALDFALEQGNEVLQLFLDQGDYQ